MMRTSPLRPTTISPAVRLEMISLLRRSEASARAAVARSCAFSLLTDSSRAADSSAFSVEIRRSGLVISLAALTKRRTANVRMEARTATTAVMPMSA
jgi:hypothetical protein